MSGHSKWKNIMHKKEKTDAQKAKVFTKIGKEIAIAVKEGGADPNSNAKLRDLIQKAKSNNVPNDNIDRIIKKASGADAVAYEEITYEGYGPSGVAVIVEAATDNRNRTAGEVRHYFDKFGGNLGTTGCVSFMFENKGVIVIEQEDYDEEKVLEDCFEAGAADVSFEDEGIIEVTTEPSDLASVADALEGMGYELKQRETAMVPNNYTRVDDPDTLKKLALLFDNLEEDDDVQNVWNNLENSEDLPEL